MSAATLDTRGLPTTKVCPDCARTIGRSRTKCQHCGHVFVGKVKLIEARRAAGEDVRQGKNITPRNPTTPYNGAGKRGPKPMREITTDSIDQSTDRMLAQVAAKGPKSLAGGFFCVAGKDGGARIGWSVYGVEFALAAAEWAAVRKVAATN